MSSHLFWKPINILSAFLYSVICKDKSLTVERIRLETVFQYIGTDGLVLNIDTNFTQRVIKFANITAVVLTMVIQFFTDTKRIINVRIVLSLVLLLFIVNLERTITCATTY